MWCNISSHIENMCQWGWCYVQGQKHIYSMAIVRYSEHTDRNSEPNFHIGTNHKQAINGAISVANPKQILRWPIRYSAQNRRLRRCVCESVLIGWPIRADRCIFLEATWSRERSDPSHIVARLFQQGCGRCSWDRGVEWCRGCLTLLRIFR